MKRIALVREAAAATIAGYRKFAVQAARRVVRLQERRRKLRRELKVVDDELRLAKRQLRDVLAGAVPERELDTPMSSLRQAIGDDVAARHDPTDPFDERHEEPKS